MTDSYIGFLTFLPPQTALRLNEFFVVKLTEDKQEDLAGNEVRREKKENLP